MSIHWGGRGPGHLSRWPKAVGDGPAPDVTAPILSSASGTATGETTASLSVTTDEGNGTLYWYVSTSATPPSAANLKAGVGAVEFDNQTVTTSGAQGASADALTAATAYYVHFIQTDAAANDSNIVTSASFTTDAASSPTLVPPTISLSSAQTDFPPILAADFDVSTLSTDTVRVHVATSLANLLAGTTVVDDAITVDTGDQSFDFSALSASTPYYYRERIERGVDVGAWSNIIKSYDLAAPVLSSPSGSQTGTTTADIAVTSDEGEGTLYYSILPAASSAPTAVQFLAGTTGGVATGSTTSPIAGSNPFSVTGLAEATAYKAHFYQQDLAERDSNISSSASFTTADATAPTLSSPTAVPAGPFMAYLTVSTNDGAGTLYWLISTSATPPSAADLKAGTGAVASGNKAVTGTGTQSTTDDGLTAGTTYYAHFLHSDSGGNDSAIVTSSSFATVNMPQASAIRLYAEPVVGTMYQEDTATTLTAANDDRVGYLPDLSGYNNHLLNNIGAANRPLYKTGTPDYVNFDGVNHYLWKDTPSFNLWSSGSFTVALAVRGNPAVSRVFVANTSSASNTPRVDIFRSDGTTASTASAFYRSDANVTIVSTPALKTGAWDNNDRVVILVDNGSSITVYVDGVAGSASAYTRSTHAMTLNRLSLGAFLGSTLSSAAAMRFHALAVWPGVVLSGGEITQATTALGAIQGRSI